jgi:serine/threonine protein phosphatase PrpC
MLEKTELGYVLATCRRGAWHIKKNIPCQDAYAIETQIVAGHTCVALAVADGHGHSRHDMSEYGAKIAVKLAVESASRFFNDFYNQQNHLNRSQLKANFRYHFPRCIGRSWREAVLQDAAVRLSVDIPRNDQVKTHKLLKRYGTTLLVALILHDLLLLGQIGDGDILRLFPDKGIDQPFQHNPLLLGNSTYSLSSSNADKLWQTTTLERQPGEAILLSTDGLSNAFTSEKQFYIFAQSLFARIKEFGVKAIDMLLPRWLDEYSKHATGDDITLVIFSDNILLDGKTTNI